MPTKNDGSYRTVELPAVIVEALKKHLDLRNEERIAAGSTWTETGRLFTTTRGTMIDPRNLLCTFYRVRERAGVPAIRFHDLRHSAATLLHAMGVPWEAIRQMLGHFSVRTTQQSYTHLTSDMASDAARKIDKFYSG